MKNKALMSGCFFQFQAHDFGSDGSWFEIQDEGSIQLHALAMPCV